MNIQLSRFRSTRLATFGVLVCGAFECFTLEDARQSRKVPKRTCIQAGTYELTLRKAGGMHQRYTQKFGPWHRGMLMLQHVPEFEYVYLHIGNTHENTEGCILVGLEADMERINRSTEAYRALYPQVANAIERGDLALLTIEDET